MINWIDINSEFKPSYHTQILVAYKPKDGSDDFGIAIGSLQYNCIKGNYWLVDSSLRGSDYDEEDFIITHWFPYQDKFNYPDEYYDKN